MKVSVVIPAFNVEDYIERCLQCILEQTYADLEIICVDDGSTDATASLIEKFIATSSRRIHFIRQSNQGASSARNTGANSATGEYIQFMDADDVLLPQKIQHQVRLAMEHGRPGLIIGSFRSISPEGEVLATVEQGSAERDPWMDLMRHRLSGTPQNLWKRDEVVRAGGWDQTLKSSQEYDLMFRMMRAGTRLIYDPHILTEVHQRKSGSISQVDVKNNWIRFINLRAAIIDHLKKIGHRDLTGPYQILFDSIRTLYPYDPITAKRFHEQLIPKDFVPSTSPATGKGYLLLHGILGFDRANKLRSMLSRRKFSS
jgi:glycosyltransferase involved in cell wall biosynthesis